MISATTVLRYSSIRAWRYALQPRRPMTVERRATLVRCAEIVKEGDAIGIGPIKMRDALDRAQLRGRCGDHGERTQIQLIRRRSAEVLLDDGSNRCEHGVDVTLGRGRAHARDSRTHVDEYRLCRQRDQRRGLLGKCIDDDDRQPFASGADNAHTPRRIYAELGQPRDRSAVRGGLHGNAGRAVRPNESSCAGAFATVLAMPAAMFSSSLMTSASGTSSTDGL